MSKIGRAADGKLRHLTWFGGLCVAVGAMVALFVVVFRPAADTGHSELSPAWVPR